MLAGACMLQLCCVQPVGDGQQHETSSNAGLSPGRRPLTWHRAARRAPPLAPLKPSARPPLAPGRSPPAPLRRRGEREIIRGWGCGRASPAAPLRRWSLRARSGCGRCPRPGRPRRASPMLAGDPLRCVAWPPGGAPAWKAQAENHSRDMSAPLLGSPIRPPKMQRCIPEDLKGGR